jgi:hypothetical protein
MNSALFETAKSNYNIIVFSSSLVPLTNGSRGAPPCGALSLLQKPLYYRFFLYTTKSRPQGEFYRIFF